MHRLIKIAAFTGIAFFATATAANASVTINSSGMGFVGKGDVQTVLGMNNAALQKAVDAKSLVFTAVQPTSQSLTQDLDQAGSQAGSQAGTQAGTQAGSQAGTQVVGQDLTCDFTNGNGTKTFHRDGVRDGERDGVRDGVAIGTRDGVARRLTGRHADRQPRRCALRCAGLRPGRRGAQVQPVHRLHPQGWKGTPVYTPGATTWNAPSFGDYSFGDYTFGAYTFGDYSFGEYAFGDYTFESVDAAEWGEWDALPGENPDDCLRSRTPTRSR